jgi:flagellar hook protein FlgE
VATTDVTLSANLPATPTAGTATAAAPISSDIDVYDALGTMHTVTLNWVQVTPDNWTVQISSPDDVAVPNKDMGTADVSFGFNANTAPSGTVGKLQPDPGPGLQGSIVTPNQAYIPNVNTAAIVQFTTDFGSGAQIIRINLGTFGQTNGVTQFAGSTYNLRGLTQNGVPPGAFSSVTTESGGNIVVNYDNGQTRTIAQVPVVTFNAPDKLQRQNGEAFTASTGSGTPLAEAPGTNGAGNLVTQSVESSNVDIAAEFSKLIVAQQAYSANTKMVTTASQMLQQTIDMKQ